MKKLLILSSMVLLSGCSILQVLTPQAQFDNAEYSELNRLYTYAEYYKVDCADAAKTNLNFKELGLISSTLVNYSKDLPNNQSSIVAITALDDLVQNSVKQMQTGSHGSMFCSMKLENIKHAAGTVKTAVAKRRR